MITPMDIHNKTFSRKLRGYAEEEVNSFLEEVVSDYERIYREHREMEEQMETLKAKLQNYEKMEATMSSTLVMAQQTAESAKENARKEADLIVREAQEKRKQIIASAEEERRRTRASILKTETDMQLYTEKLLNTFRSAMTMVESVKSLKGPDVAEPAAPAAAPSEEAPALPEEAPETAPEETLAEAENAAEEAVKEEAEENKEDK